MSPHRAADPSTSAITLDLYSHVTPTMHRQAAERRRLAVWLSERLSNRHGVDLKPFYGPLAQLAEHRAFNPQVQGSSPWRPTAESLVRCALPGTYWILNWALAPDLAPDNPRARDTSAWHLAGRRVRRHRHNDGERATRPTHRARHEAGRRGRRASADHRGTLGQRRRPAQDRRRGAGGVARACSSGPGSDDGLRLPPNH